jgi:hypothetical protein
LVHLDPFPRRKIAVPYNFHDIRLMDIASAEPDYAGQR